MPDAVSVAMGKAVEAALAAATLSQVIAPERSYADWELQLKDANTLRVDVVVVTTEQKTQLSSRGSSRFTVPIDIAVRKRFEGADLDDATGRVDVDEVDALCLLVQEIHELFTPERLDDALQSVWQATDILVCPLLKHLRELRQFTGIVRVTFQAHT